MYFCHVLRLGIFLLFFQTNFVYDTEDKEASFIFKKIIFPVIKYGTIFSSYNLITGQLCM